MAQLNLLPDVKLEYIRAQNRKRAVIGISVIVSAVFLAILISLLIFVRGAQKQHLNALDRDINAHVKTLQQTQDLDKILTVQNQLNSLPALHNDKVISSRTFDYLRQLTPEKATISDVTLDFEAGTLVIEGTADALSTVNKFADTLKFTTFKSEGDNPQEGEAFQDVVLKSFAVSGQGSSSSEVTYELEMKFNAAIYANSAPSNEGKSPVKLTVPNIISTRSATQSPSNLFAPQPGEEQ